MSERAGPVAGGEITPRRIDLVLVVLLVLLATAGLLFSGIEDPFTFAAGAALVLWQIPVVLLRRTRPLASLVAWAAPVAVAAPLGVPESTFAWSVLAFALFRAHEVPPGGRGRAAGALALVLAGTMTVVGVLRWISSPDRWAVSLGFAVGWGLTVAVFAVVGAVLGRISRTSDERDESARIAVERARLDAALEAERARIADEVGSGVLAGLRRLVTRIEALSPDDGPVPSDDGRALTELRDDAREVLARMRRVLGVLREPVPAATGDAPVSRVRRMIPLPTRSGLVLGAVVAVVAAGIDAIPLAPIGDARVDSYLRLLDLPHDVPAAWPFVAVQVAALLYWRSTPVAALVAATAGAAGAGLLGATNWVVESGWMVLVYAAGVGAAPRRSGPVVAGCTLVVLAGYLSSGVWYSQLPSGASSLTVSYVVVPVLWLVGVLRRRHRSDADALRRSRDERVRHAAVEQERLRVARELHDVVAHHVSAISVQAAAGGMTSDPVARRDAVRHVSESGRRVAAALPELSGLTPDPGEVALSADGIDVLLAPVREAGVPLTVETDGEPAEPAGDAELFAQRILTEALTNVVRHAGPSRTRVCLAHEAEAVSVLVSDRGPVAGHRPGDGGSGLGLVGMRERAELLGGSLEAGAGPDGGWVVRARLPRSPSGTAGLLRAEEAGTAISSASTTRASPGPA